MENKDNSALWKKEWQVKKERFYRISINLNKVGDVDIINFLNGIENNKKSETVRLALREYMTKEEEKKNETK